MVLHTKLTPAQCRANLKRLKDRRTRRKSRYCYRGPVCRRFFSLTVYQNGLDLFRTPTPTAFGFIIQRDGETYIHCTVQAAGYPLFYISPPILFFLFWLHTDSPFLSVITMGIVWLLEFCRILIFNRTTRGLAEEAHLERVLFKALRVE